MAITTAWTTSIPSHKRPSGFTNPSVAELTNPAEENFIIDIDSTTIENADPAVGLTALGDAVKTDIDANYLEDVWGLDPLKTITGRIVITKRERRFDNFEPSDEANQEIASSQITRVWGVFQWEAPA